MIVKYEKLHCISVICIAQQLENEIITVVDYKILYYYNFGHYKSRVPELKIFQVNVNVKRQPPATVHLRWHARLAFKIYINIHVYYNGN